MTETMERNPTNKLSNVKHFSVFAILYMTSFLSEMIESWQYVNFTWASLVLISIITLTQVNRATFLLFLGLSTTYIMVFRFPEVANHVNLIILVNCTLIIGIIYSYLRKGMNDEGFYRMMKPLMRLSLILVYFIAGFHKINHDFFHPDVSCVGGFIAAYFGLLFYSKVFFIPSSIILIIGIIILTRRLIRPWPKRFSWLVIIASLALLIVVSLILLGLLSFFVPGGLTILKTIIIVSVSSIIIAWELVGGPLLLIPKFQGKIIAFSAMMHASFALIGFVDFSSFAVTLLFTFIPANYLHVFDQNSHVTFWQFRIHRVYVYFFIMLIGGFLTAIHYLIAPIFGDMDFLHGVIFNSALTIFIWPILSMVFSQQRLPWRGVRVIDQPIKLSVLIGFVLIMLFWGMTSYLGLRTAGNFSMFSNLRTEGRYANHYLLRSNPLKIWGYQEDVVEIIEIDDEQAEIGHKYTPLKGYRLPVVEFKKLIHKWTEAKYIVPIKFKYNGVEYSSSNIVNDPIWQTPKRNWEMYFMDFRIIQAEGPNQCRW